MLTQAKKRSQAGKVWCFCDGSTGAIYEAQRLANAAAALPAAAAGNTASGVTLRQRLEARLVCSAAAVVRADDGRILDLAWRELPELTNNEAEYAGLVLGLQLAKRLRVQEVLCVLDSEVVVGQMEGRFAINSARLRRWHWKAAEAARKIPVVRYRLAPREWNRLADGLAGQASVPWPALCKALGE